MFWEAPGLTGILSGEGREVDDIVRHTANALWK